VIVEVNNIALFDYYEGFSHFQEQIFQCKMNLLFQLSKAYPGAKFVFYNALGRFGLVEELYKLFENIFEEFEIVFDKEVTEFDSSPVNNVPCIRVDRIVMKLEDADTIGLKFVNDDNDLKCEYNRCFYILENLTEKEHSERVLAIKVDVSPKNFFESGFVNSLNSTNQRYLVLKLIRGEDVCL